MASITVTGVDQESGQATQVTGGDAIVPANQGDLTIYNGGVPSGTGGSISIEGGDVAAGAGVGGVVTIIGGQGGASGTAGAVNIIGGYGGILSGDGAAVNIISGQPTQISSGASGDVFTRSETTVFSPPITTTKSGAQALPAATITVVSTAAFPTAGQIHFNAGSPTIQSIAYTGTTGTSFTGCTGGTGTLGDGTTITYFSDAQTGDLGFSTGISEGESGQIDITTGDSRFALTGDINISTGAPDTAQFAGAKTAPAGGITLSTPGARTDVASGNITITAEQVDSGVDNMGGRIFITGGGNGQEATEAIIISTEDGTVGQSSSISIITGAATGEGLEGPAGYVAIDNGANDGNTGSGHIYMGQNNATNIDIGHAGCAVTIQDLISIVGSDASELTITSGTGQDTRVGGGVGTAGSGTGGQSIIEGGAGGTPDGDGGGAFALGGLGVGTGIGGAVQLTGGTGGDTDGEGGGVLANGGLAIGAGTGGAFQAVGGTGGDTGTGGGIIIVGGAGGVTSGNGGSAEFYGGPASTSGVGGEVIIAGGDAAGADQPGSSLSLCSGLGTGDGSPSNATISTTAYGATSTSLQTFVERVYIKGQFVGLTDNTATSLFDVALPAGALTGVRLTWTVYATDGTDFQSRNGQSGFSAVNKAGTITNAVDAGSSSLAASAGTLSVTFTVLNGASIVTLQVTADSSLTVTDLYILYTIQNDSMQALTVIQ